MTAKDILLTAYRSRLTSGISKTVRQGWLVTDIIAYEITQENVPSASEYSIFKVTVARKDRKDRCNLIQELTKFKKDLSNAEKYIRFLRQSGCKR